MKAGSGIFLTLLLLAPGCISKSPLEIEEMWADHPDVQEPRAVIDGVIGDTVWIYEYSLDPWYIKPDSGVVK